MSVFARINPAELDIYRPSTGICRKTITTGLSLAGRRFIHSDDDRNLQPRDCTDMERASDRRQPPTTRLGPAGRW